MLKKTVVWILAVLVVLALAAVSCSGKKSETPGPAAGNDSGEPAVREQADAGTGNGREPEPAPSVGIPASGDWKDAFKFVRDAIRTEPSRFALKTAEAIQWGRSANPLEKALFLCRLLQDKGMTVEVAEGELDSAAAKELLGGMFPPGRSFSRDKDVPVSAPSADPALIAAVTRHFWVRMEDGERWVDLDPSFPGAEADKAYAPVKETYDPADEALSASLSLAVESAAGNSNEAQPVLAWEGGLEDVANKPLSLTVTARFEAAEAEEAKEEEGGGVGGLFGGLSGGTSAKKKPAPGTKTFYTASLGLDGEGLEEGDIDAGAAPVARISLRLKIVNLGQVVSETERVLFEAARNGDEPPLFERHSILITAGRIPAQAWQDKLQAAADKDLLAGVKSRVDEVKSGLKDKKADRDLLDRGVELEAKLGPGLGHLMNMIFASTSDEQTGQAAEALSVAYWYAEPRVLITSFVSGERVTETVLDLRLDRVEAVPLPGQALSMKQAFLYGRGVTESALEGKLLEIFGGKPALSTAALLEEAARQKIPIRMFSKLEKNGLEGLGLPDGVLAKMSPALEAGRIIVVPEKSVNWEGRKRWGWWDVDPRTMETIGVLDTGLHQAMMQRTILETEGPLNSKMGMVLGAMVGAIDTYWVLSAMILKYGELNKAALLEAKAYMKSIQSVMCPEFEKKAGVSVSLTVIDIEDCYKKEIEIFSIEGGVKVEMGWCQQFAKGFACASTSILNYYLSQFED